MSELQVLELHSLNVMSEKQIDKKSVAESKVLTIATSRLWV